MNVWNGHKYLYLTQQNIMSLQVTLIIILLSFTNAYTNITTINCPAQFNITAFNQSSETSALGAFVYSAFTSSTNQQRVESIVISGDNEDLKDYQQQMMTPYIIFAVFYLLVYILLVLCCLFDRSCPPSQCLRRNLQENPYSQKEFRGVTIVLTICAAGILTATIVGYSLIPAMKEDLEMTNCGIYLALDTAMNGDETWGGYVTLKNKIGNITNLLTSAVTQIQIYFPGDQWLVDSMKAMRTAALDLYNKYKSSQLTTPNPDSTATANNAGQPTPVIDSRFIKTGMGPNGTSNTMVTDIDLGLRTTKKLSDQAYSITKSAALLEASLSTILINSQASQQTLLMYNTQLGVVKTEYDLFSKEYFDDKLRNNMTALQIIYGMALAGSLILLLGVLSTHSFQLLSCRHMVNFGWTIYGFTYLGLIFLTYNFLSLGSISYNFCTYFQSMLTVQVNYNKLGDSYTQNMFTRLDVCLFGNGNAMQKFSISKQMETVSNLFTNIQTYYDYTNSISTNYINTGISTGKISGWRNAVNKYKLGIYVDTDPVITSNDNPNYAINQLNLYTYQGGGVATGSKDVWVWDKLNCTDPTYTVYTAGSSPGVGLSTSSVTCISFNQKLSTLSSSRWSFSDFTMRYIQIRQAYPDAYKQIQYYGQTLIAFRDSRINLFQAIEDDLSALYTTNTNFNSQLSLFNNRVTQFYGAVATLNNEITNTLDGLTVISNCHQIADKLRFINNVFCKSFMGEVVKLTLCTLVMLVVMLVGICAGSRIALMFAELEKIKIISQPEEAQSEKDIRGLGQLQEQMTNSSRSNDSED